LRCVNRDSFDSLAYMKFDPNNRIIQLCASGMQREAELDITEAGLLYKQAWAEAGNDFEKCIAAHYLARHQGTVESKLKWDELALSLALKHDDNQTENILPSLFLNVGKCYEDLGNMDRANENYSKAEFFIESLADDGYGRMIKSGVKAGLARVAEKIDLMNKMHKH